MVRAESTTESTIDEGGLNVTENDPTQTKGISFNKWTSLAKSIVTNITCEPVLLLHSIVFFGLEPVRQSLVEDKACLVMLSNSEEVCQNLIQHRLVEIQVQEEASRLQGIALFLACIFPVLLNFYVGPLSDRFGRKPFLVACVAIEAVGIMGFLLNSIFMYLPVEFLILSYFVETLGGGLASFQMLIFACMADVTTDANRTFRLGILKIFMAYGTPLGRIFGGQAYALGGYIAVFGGGGALYAVCVLYLLLSSETVPKEDMQKNREKKLGVKWLLQTPVILFSVVFRSERRRRKIIVCNLISHLTFYLGRTPQFYLFFRLMFDWDATAYSNWLFYKDIVAATAMVVMVPLLVKRLQWPDAAVGMVAAASLCFMYILLAQITNERMMWLTIVAPIAGMLNYGNHLASRTIISKCSVGSTDLGKLFAAQGVMDSLGVAVAALIYSLVYSSTVDTQPGAQFLVAAAFMAITVFGFRLTDVFIQEREDDLIVRREKGATMNEEPLEDIRT